jgi:hypothetical protein
MAALGARRLRRRLETLLGEERAMLVNIMGPAVSDVGRGFKRNWIM